jgi:hypothetical protein
MRGVPLTQVTVSIYTMSFVIIEVLRLVAGIAGANDLRPGPIVLRTKEILVCIQYLFSGCVATHAFCTYTTVFLYPLKVVAVPVSKGGSLMLRLAGVNSINVSLALALTIISHIPWRTRTRLPLPAKSTPGWFQQKWLRARSQFAACASTYLALNLPPSSFEFVLIFGVLTVVHTLWLTNFLPSSSPPDLTDINEHVHYYDLPCILLGIPTFLPIPYFLHRFFFMGSMSRYPQYLFGLKGPDREFWAGTFIMVNIVACVLAYTTFWSEGINTTYRPIWADYLG